jgi:hypothetical protein
LDSELSLPGSTESSAGVERSVDNGKPFLTYPLQLGWGYGFGVLLGTYLAVVPFVAEKAHVSEAAKQDLSGSNVVSAIPTNPTVKDSSALRTLPVTAVQRRSIGPITPFPRGPIGNPFGVRPQARATPFASTPAPGIQ